MAVFSDKEDEVAALLVGNGFLVFGLYVILSGLGWLTAALGGIVLVAGIYILVAAFREYQIEGIRQMWNTYLLLFEAVQREGATAWQKK